MTPVQAVIELATLRDLVGDALPAPEVWAKICARIDTAFAEVIERRILEEANLIAERKADQLRLDQMKQDMYKMVEAQKMEMERRMADRYPTMWSNHTYPLVGESAGYGGSNIVGISAGVASKKASY